MLALCYQIELEKRGFSCKTGLYPFCQSMRSEPVTRFVLTFLITFLLPVSIFSAGAQSPSGGKDPFTIRGVAVDVISSTATKAREGGLVFAQREAWKTLWGRLTGKAESEAPQLSDSTLLTIVAAVDVETERFSSKRYVARLSVVFDPIAVRRFLGKIDGQSTQRSRPMLLIPVLRDAAASYTFNSSNAWFQAWGRFSGSQSPIDYVHPNGGAADAIVLTAYQAGRHQLNLVRLALLRYGAEDLMVAEARLDRRYPGGPIWGTFTVYHGLSHQPLARFSLRASNDTTLPAMLDDAVLRIDQIMTNALNRGLLARSEAINIAASESESASEPTIGVQSFSGLDVQVETADASAWTAMEAKLKQARSVSSVTLTDLSLGGISKVRLAYNEGIDWLKYDLDQVGLRLVGQTGGGWLIRTKRAGDAPLLRPKTPEELAAEQEASGAADVSSQPNESKNASPRP